MKIKYYIIPLVFLSFNAVSALAQEKKVEEKTVEEMIEIVRPYKPVLADAFKLRRSPDLENIQTYKAKFNYTVTERRLELNSDINKVEAEKLIDERPEVLVNNYFKLGAGLLNTFTTEGYINTGSDEALQAGLFFRHFGQKSGDIGQLSNHQQVTAFGKSILDKFSLQGKLNYQRQGLSFYGFDPLVSSVNPAYAKQSFNLIEGEGEVFSNYSTDENALSYAAKANLYTFKDAFSAKESLFTLSASLNKRISDLNLGLNFSTELGKTSDITTSNNNNLLRLNPYIKFQTNDIKLTAGVNFVQEFGSTSDTKIFPTATADLTIVPDYLQLFAEVKGDVNRNTLRDLTKINPYLGQNQTLENSIEKLNIQAGVKGTAGPGFGYKVKIYSQKVNNLPLFANRYGDIAKFDIIYDRGNTTITGIEGAMSVQVSNDLTWTGKINFEQFSPATELHVWMRPGARINSDLAYNINKKLTLNGAVYIQSDTKAKIYNGPVAQPYVVDHANETTKKIKGFVDLGAGVDYKINNQFGAFVKANNLLNQNNYRYLYYPSFGINIFGGISYSF